MESQPAGLTVIRKAGGLWSNFRLGLANPGGERGSLARRRVQRGVFGAQTYDCTLSTENVELGPYPPRVSPAQGKQRVMVTVSMCRSSTGLSFTVGTACIAWITESGSHAPKFT